MPEKAARAKAVKSLARQRAAQPTLTVRPPATRSAEAARQFAIDAARLMTDEKCEDVVVLDLRGVSPVCDFFVIGTGTSDRQMRAVADHVEQLGKSIDDPPYGVNGLEEGVWIIVDFVDVVVHLFDAERRLYYDLESLWGDGTVVKWER